MKILIIQQKMIGDVLLSTMLCEQIKKNISNTEVHYLINNYTEAIVTNNPNIDRIILFNEDYRNSKWLLFEFLNNMTHENYDVVIDAYGKLESILISLFSKAKVKISMDKWYSRAVYTNTFKYKKNGNSCLGLAVENRLKLLNPFISDIIAITNYPKVYLTDDEISRAKLFLENNNIDFSKPILMINILGSSPSKTYPLQCMAEIIDQISCQGEFTMLFNYTPSQSKQARELYNLCSPRSKGKIRFDVYAPSLRAFLSVLYHCKAILGNEGGAINMAKALNIPTFSIFSPWVDQATWETFKDIKHNVAVHLNDYKPLLLNGKSRKKLKKDYKSLYDHFKPFLFKDNINHFLESYIFINKDKLPCKPLQATVKSRSFEKFLV